MLEGKIDEGIISVNTGIDIIKTLPSVQNLVDQLMG
jgi:enoyl-[acyl-carrier protein] reductase II